MSAAVVKHRQGALLDRQQVQTTSNAQSYLNHSTLVGVSLDQSKASQDQSFRTAHSSKQTASTRQPRGLVASLLPRGQQVKLKKKLRTTKQL